MFNFEEFGKFVKSVFITFLKFFLFLVLHLSAVCVWLLFASH